MKNNRKRLNNKGFTLIELLAVVVILAVVMGIAMTSVLSSMNNSRMGSLVNSAESVSQAFQTKYSESMLTNTLGSVYKDIIGSYGYNFTKASTESPVFYNLTEDLSENLNISKNTYALDGKLAAAPTSKSTNKAAFTADKSFIAFDGKTVVTCMVAVDTGSYYVANSAIEAGKNATEEIHGVTVTFPTGTMYACSIDDMNSWTSPTLVAAAS